MSESFDFPLNASVEQVGESCTKILHQLSSTTSSSPSPSSQQQFSQAARELARLLVDRHIVQALVHIRGEQYRIAIRDELLQLLLRQMTNQAPPSTSQHPGLDTNLPAGVEDMATLISLNAVSQEGSAMTIKKLLDAPPFRRPALALLAKVGEGIAKERLAAHQRFQQQVASSSSSSSSSSENNNNYYKNRNKNRKSNNNNNNNNASSLMTTASVPITTPTLSQALVDRMSAFDFLESSVHQLSLLDPSVAYECNFIIRCFGWSSPPSIHLVHNDSLSLIRRPHRVPCYSVVALPNYYSNNNNNSSSSSSPFSSSIVAACGRSANTVDLFRDVGVHQDCALSSFTVPPAYAPLTLVNCGGNNNNNNNDNNNNSKGLLVALCCGVEVSEKVGVGVLKLDGSSPFPSSGVMDVREVYGVSQPTCAVPAPSTSSSSSSSSSPSPMIAVGCAVPGGYGITSVVVETTQRLHTIVSDSSSEGVTCLASHGDVLFSASRDGNVEAWDARRNPRGPAQSVLSPNAMRGDATSSMALVSTIPSAPVPQLLVTGSVDGLLRVWDLRQLGTEAGAKGMSQPLAYRQLDGPIASLCVLPTRTSSPSLAKHQKIMKMRKLGVSGEQQQQLDEEIEKKQMNNAEGENNNNEQAEGDQGGGEGNEQQQQQQEPPIVNIAVSTTRGLNMLRLDHQGGLVTEQVIPSRSSSYNNNNNTTTSASSSAGNNNNIADVYHDLCLASNFGGTNDTYLLGGSELGSIDTFRVHQL